MAMGTIPESGTHIESGEMERQYEGDTDLDMPVELFLSSTR